MQATAVAAAFWQPQVQSDPRQVLQVQRFCFDSFMRGSNEVRVAEHGAQCKDQPADGLERNGYSGRTLAGEIPNILLNVREKCAESAKPPAWAASVSVLPDT